MPPHRLVLQVPAGGDAFQREVAVAHAVEHLWGAVVGQSTPSLPAPQTLAQPYALPPSFPSSLYINKYLVRPAVERHEQRQRVLRHRVGRVGGDVHHRQLRVLGLWTPGGGMLSLRMGNIWAVGFGRLWMGVVEGLTHSTYTHICFVEMHGAP